MYFGLGSEIESTSKKLKLLVGQHLVEKEIPSVILICLHLAFGGRRVDRLIEQFNQHGQVVLVRWFQALLFFHLLIIKDIADMLIAEIVIRLAQKLDFYLLRILLMALIFKEAKPNVSSKFCEGVQIDDLRLFKNLP